MFSMILLAKHTVKFVLINYLKILTFKSINRKSNYAINNQLDPLNLPKLENQFY